MTPAMCSLIALQDRAIALTALLAVVAMIAPVGPEAAIQPRLAVRPGLCRKLKPEMIRTSFSRRWTEPDFRRVAMELVVEAAAAVAEMAEVAAVGDLAVRREGSRNPAATFRDSSRPDAGMTGSIEMTEATERSVARAPISQTR